MNMQEVHAEIEAAISKVAWINITAADLPLDAESFRGHADGWTFLIVVWHDGPEGMGVVRCDGTATKSGVIMRLTPELAKKAAEGAVT